LDYGTGFPLPYRAGQNPPGAGTPLGILNSTALITVAKETGQGSATVISENVNKMWKRLPAPSRMAPRARHCGG